MFSKIIGNIKTILVMVAAILLIVSVIMTVWNVSLREDNKRLSTNQEALTSDVERYRTESGKEAVRAMQLMLKKDEFEHLCKDQSRIIEDLNIKVKRLKGMSSTGTNTSTGGKVQTRDTVVKEMHDTLYIEKKARYFSWSDQWNRVYGFIDGDSIECRYDGTDTLHIIEHRVPRKFLWFRFGTKYDGVTVTNTNPSTHITFTKAVRVDR